MRSRVAMAIGFYYGIAKQKRMEQQEEAKAAKKRATKKKSGQSVTPPTAAQDKVPVIRETTLLERQLGLHRPVTPNIAAMKALIGGTIVSVSGCAVLLFSLAAVLGVRNVSRALSLSDAVLARRDSALTHASLVFVRVACAAGDGVPRAHGGRLPAHAQQRRARIQRQGTTCATTTAHVYAYV